MNIRADSDCITTCFLLFRKPGSGPSLCSKSRDVESPYYRPLQACIGGTQSRRWIPIQERSVWPSRAQPTKSELAIYGNYYFSTVL